VGIWDGINPHTWGLLKAVHALKNHYEEANLSTSTEKDF
jgi:hypothetical protein